MSVVRPDDVRRVAALARLQLSDVRLTELAAQLDGILAHMEVLRAIPVERLASVEPVEVGMPLRADEGPPIPLASPIEAFAPATRDGFLLVPRLASHESVPGESEA